MSHVPANAFKQALTEGRAGESLIAGWLQRKGCNILPAYEIEQPQFKGPRVFSAERNLVAPDWLAFGYPKVDEKPRVGNLPQREKRKAYAFWCEAKSKAAFTWHRLSGTYQDGVDRCYWLDYLELRRRMCWPLWLFFLHAPGGLAKDNPAGMMPPSGLFGGEVRRLAGCIHHESDRWGKGGMVYWRCDDLMAAGKPLATYEEVCTEAEA